MKYTLSDLTEQELNTILNSLAQSPYVQVFQLIGKIQQQYQVQSLDSKTE
jgi:hypothetical protein